MDRTKEIHLADIDAVVAEDRVGHHDTSSLSPPELLAWGTERVSLSIDRYILTAATTFCQQSSAEQTRSSA